MKENIFQECLTRWKESDGFTPFWKELAKKFGYDDSEKLRYEFKYERKRRGIKKDPITKGLETNCKILLYDIETTPILALVWGIWNYDVNTEAILQDWHIASWSAKWLFSDEIMSDVLTVEEAENHNDRRIVESLWKIINEADVIVGHNCVEESTLILTADLKWVTAGSLKEGDLVVGFEENSDTNLPRKILPSTVTSNHIEPKECFEVSFDNGDKITVTEDHKWLKLAAKGRDYRWCETRNLKVGQRVEKFIAPWKQEESFDAGWLSGFISGEGTLKQSGRSFSIDMCQRPGATWDQALEISDKLGFYTSSFRSPKTGGLGKQDTLYTGFLGGKWKAVEIIGKLNIKRFIEKIDWNKFGTLKSKYSHTSTIISIKPVGKKNVAVLSTSTKTFIAEGYPMHNCDKFDNKKLNTRFLAHGMLPMSHHQSVDTLKIAKEAFNFTSNRLDYINEYLGIPKKEKTEFELWKRVFHADPKALKEMETYNRNDVDILEDLFLRLRPYAKGLPNMNLWNEENVSVCPSCGSKELDWNTKPYYTYTGRYKAFRCTSCGALGRSRTQDLSPEKRKAIVR